MWSSSAVPRPASKPNFRAHSSGKIPSEPSARRIVVSPRANAESNSGNETDCPSNSTSPWSSNQSIPDSMRKLNSPGCRTSCHRHGLASPDRSTPNGRTQGTGRDFNIEPAVGVGPAFAGIPFPATATRLGLPLRDFGECTGLDHVAPMPIGNSFAEICCPNNRTALRLAAVPNATVCRGATES